MQLQKEPVFEAASQFAQVGKNSRQERRSLRHPEAVRGAIPAHCQIHSERPATAPRASLHRDPPTKHTN